MKKRIILRIAEQVLPKLLEIAIKLLEELLKVDLDNDGKIGRL